MQFPPPEVGQERPRVDSMGVASICTQGTASGWGLQRPEGPRPNPCDSAGAEGRLGALLSHSERGGPAETTTPREQTEKSSTLPLLQFTPRPVQHGSAKPFLGLYSLFKVRGLCCCCETPFKGGRPHEVQLGNSRTEGKSSGPSA